MKKKILGIMLGMCVSCFVMGCAGGNANNEKDVLNVAYQYGLAYAPVAVVQQEELIQKAYKETTGKDVEIVWTQMSSGADINTGISSGTIDVGFMGVAPAITGCTKGVGYKIFTSLSGQEHGMMTNDSSITSLKDIVGSDKQIALVNTGSIQHIILARALVENGFGAHDLDANIVAMKHPDGMTALETKNVPLHLTSNPYIYKEREEADLSEIPEIANTWNATDNTFIVGVASTNLHDNKTELYSALCKAFDDAINEINADIEKAAQITYEFDGNTLEDEIKYMKLGEYSSQTKGVFELAKFMGENEFIESAPASYSDLAFDNVKGD